MTATPLGSLLFLLVVAGLVISLTVGIVEWDKSRARRQQDQIRAFLRGDWR